MPRWKVWFLTLFVCCGTVFSVFSQSTSNWQRYNQDSIGIDLQGSSSLSFSPLTNLWVTHVGQRVISRLDGYEVRSFPPPEEDGFKVYESKTEQLWAYHPLGLQSFDGNSRNSHVVGKIRQEMQLKPLRVVRPIPLLPTVKGSGQTSLLTQVKRERERLQGLQRRTNRNARAKELHRRGSEGENESDSAIANSFSPTILPSWLSSQ